MTSHWPPKPSAAATRELPVREGRLYLEDLGSRLGTYLWDKRIESKGARELRNGDQFTVFPYRFRTIIEQTWSPETDIELRECQTWALSQGEFVQTSPRGWSNFLVNAHPGGEQAVMQVSPAFLTELQQRMLAPVGLQSTKDSVPSDGALTEFIVMALVERLNRSMKFGVHFSLGGRPYSKPAAAARGMLLSFAIGIAGLTGQFRVFLPVDFLAQSKPAAGPPNRDYWPAGISWKFPVSAGFVDLSPHEIAQVGPGDILVAQPAPAILFPNHFGQGWAVTPATSNFARVRFDKYFERGVPLGTASEPLGSAARPDVESLPLQLHVVVGEREFTLAEIQSLSPGTVVELGTDRSDPVRLMINGKILGEGELVEVEGKLGVRVLRWRSA